MKLRFGIALAVGLAALSPAQTLSLEVHTRQILDQVLKHKPEAFYALFSPEMKKAISLATYGAQVDQILTALGQPTGQDPPVTQQVQGLTVVNIAVHWPQATLNFIVSWNKTGQVEGTWFRQPESAKPPPSYETASYSKPDKFTNRDVTIGGDPWKLPGTLTVPTGPGPFAGVVLVHGSGPNDRDETVGGAKVFRDLAEGLATRGIAVLRYDKRTKEYPAQCAADPNFTVNQETVEDALHAVALLRQQKEIDPRRVFVLGHSLGGYVDPRIMQGDPKLAGAVVMAGNVRPLEELIVEQSEYLMRLQGNFGAPQQAQLDAIKRDPWKVVPGIPDSYVKDLKSYDPIATAMRSTVPMLILQGGRDYQVTMSEFELWKDGLASRTGVTMHSYLALNHLFEAGDPPSRPEEYEQPGHVAPEVIEDIAAWILHTK